MLEYKGKKEKGITIIALIITIIILIILAGISIAAINGDSGIILNSSKAKFRTDIRDIEEKIELTEIEENDGEDFKFGTIKDFIGRDDEYNEMLFIENGDLVYEKNKVSEEQSKWLEEMNIHEKQGIIPIYTKEELVKIASGEEVSISELGGRIFTFNKDSHYVIQNDINLEGNESNQWQTISAFDGILDGQNYNLSGVYINTTDHYKGLFNTNNGVIKNIKIMDCSISGGARTGVICSTNNGEVNKIEIYGTIKSTNTEASASNIGSICGQNSNKIYDVSNYADIVGIQANVGGICGTNGVNGVIERCENIGYIVGSKNAAVGGITGTNNGIIKICKNEGDVATGTNYTWNEGGICGANSGSIENCYNLGNLGTKGLQERNIGGIAGGNGTNATISNCYSIAEIVGGSIGGITSRNSGNINNCWYIKKGNYDLQLSDSTGTAKNSGEKTEEEMKSSSFVEILNQGNSEQLWKQSSNRNNGYPYLKWEEE